MKFADYDKGREVCGGGGGEADREIKRYTHARTHTHTHTHTHTRTHAHAHAHAHAQFCRDVLVRMYFVDFEVCLIALFALDFKPSHIYPLKTLISPTGVVSKTLIMGSENPGPTYWEGKAPPSSVLGIGAGLPSGVLGPLSLVAFAAGERSLAQPRPRLPTHTLTHLHA